MCTVSIIPFRPPVNGHAASYSPSTLGGAAGAGGASAATWGNRRIGFRLVTNRDELRTRPPAADPRWHDFTSSSVDSGRPSRAIYPIDPAGGGTWIGGSTSGLVLCILNGNPIPAPVLPPRGELVSRGVIIPRLFELAGATRSVVDVLKHLDGFDLNRFAPFRLVGVAPTPEADQGGFTAVEAIWDRRGLVLREHPPGPACFVSSGLGDPLVKPRITLFNEMVRAARSPLADLAGEQDRFHRHTWEDRPEISVLMNRREARTVSITSVEVAPSGEAEHAAYDLSLEYEPIGERSPALAANAPVLTKHKVTIPGRIARQAQ